jgi:hypothetical protein
MLSYTVHGLNVISLELGSKLQPDEEEALLKNALAAQLLEGKQPELAQPDINQAQGQFDNILKITVGGVGDTPDLVELNGEAIKALKVVNRSIFIVKSNDKYVFYRPWGNLDD